MGYRRLTAKCQGKIQFNEHIDDFHTWTELPRGTLEMPRTASRFEVKTFLDTRFFRSVKLRLSSKLEQILNNIV